MSMIKVYILRLMGKEITLIVAALMASKLQGAEQLATKLLKQVMR